VIEHDGLGNPAPDAALGVTGIGKRFGARGGFRLGLVAVAFDQQVRCAPDLEVGYHVGETGRKRSLKA
jgi:hypothetical protein